MYGVTRHADVGPASFPVSLSLSPSLSPPLDIRITVKGYSIRGLHGFTSPSEATPSSMLSQSVDVFVLPTLRRSDRVVVLSLEVEGRLWKWRA